jgi:chromate reductase
MKILGLAGSIRRESFTRRLLKEVELTLASEDTLSTFDIGTLPHYNGDLDGDTRPDAVNELIATIKDVDGLFFVTPEYNYAIPGVLKNAIDWASRPAYTSCLAHKPTAIMAASPSPVGGARALANLRQILGGTVTDMFPHPEFLVARVHEKFGKEGLSDASTKEHLERYVRNFVDWAKVRSRDSA